MWSPREKRLAGVLLAVFLVLSVAALAVLRKVWWEGEVSRMISLFPGVQKVLDVPPPPEGPRQKHWLFRSSARLEEVHRFYVEPEHHPGWTLEEKGAMHLIFRKRSARLTLTLDRDPSGSGTLMVFSLNRGGRN
ncbi:MAG: hypothetical protein HY549_07420 [Elusimicrobia bacterium]|nr:hypothetical protein [Elusimicrobiota bacterium]